MGKYYVKKYNFNNVGTFVNEAILLSGIKKKKVAELAGISKQMLSYKLHDKVAWSMDDLVAVAEVLDVDVAILMGQQERSE
jgi:transcriptional regulator with XRE-family HTH domain